MITHAELLNTLTYDRETGLFAWIDVFYPRKPDRVGTVTAEGYLATRIRGKGYKLHRLAFFYIHARWPTETDHINGNRQDNRIVNLREVTHGQNQMNKPQAHKTNKLGIKGVKKTLRGLGYVARITKDGKQIQIGYFRSAEEAGEARRKAELELHGEYAAMRQAPPTPE